MMTDTELDAIEAMVRLRQPHTFPDPPQGSAGDTFLRLVAEVRRLREQVQGHCERIARQSELLSRRAESAWRPIETLDLDCGEVIVCTAAGRVSSYAAATVRAWQGDPDAPAVTHWRPLPLPPTH